jgi:hypothetical protein
VYLSLPLLLQRLQLQEDHGQLQPAERFELANTLVQGGYLVDEVHVLRPLHVEVFDQHVSDLFIIGLVHFAPPFRRRCLNSGSGLHIGQVGLRVTGSKMYPSALAIEMAQSSV